MSQFRRRRSLCAHAGAGALTLVIALVGLAPSPVLRAEDATQTVTWAQLVPPAPPGQAKALKSFLANRPAGNVPPPVGHPGGGDGRWLSAGSAPQSGAGAPAVVEALDGKRVKIGGYVVPLDFDATKVREFLLVPFVGACIHVPPPPANQIVYVKSAAGFDVKGSFEPVWVTGRLATKVAFTGLAEAGYSLEADAVEARPE